MGTVRTTFIIDENGVVTDVIEKVDTKNSAAQILDLKNKKQKYGSKKEETGGAAVSSEKLKALQNAMSKIEKDYGRGAIMKLGDENIEDIEVIPSGIIGLDYALGVGGYPRGRIIEIFGPESSGKTTLAILAIAQAQKQGGIAAIIDAEHAFDRFMQKVGRRREQSLDITTRQWRASARNCRTVDTLVGNRHYCD